MKVINLWNGPGAGKSTTAAGLFYYMKTAGKKVELVTEFAKELVYEEDASRIRNSLVLLGEQTLRLHRLDGKVDYAITDSPLPLNAVYARPPFDQPWFFTACNEAFRIYDNVNYLIQRVKPYQAYGRYQNEEQARELDKIVEAKLAEVADEYSIVRGDEHAPAKLMRDLFSN